MSSVVRLGIVGTGNRGVSVGRNFQAHPRCRITALMDRFAATTHKAADALNLPDARHFTDYDTFLRDAPIDAVFLACAPTEQVQMACAAMARGKHVCTEVPAAFTLDELRALIAAVERSGCKYQIMEQLRYAGFVDVWRGMVRRGELGHVCQAQGEYIHYRKNWNYWVDTKSGEMIFDVEPTKGREVAPTWRYQILGEPILYLPHTLSPMLRVLDDRVTKVSCMGTRKGSYTHEPANLPWHEIQYALMHTAKDTLLLVGAGFSMPAIGRGGGLASHWYEFRGTKGSVESPRGIGGKFHAWTLGDREAREYQESYADVDLSTAPLESTEEERRSGHGGLDYLPPRNFVDAILNDTDTAANVYVTAQFTAPAIVAAESARRGGELLEVPDFGPPQK